MYSVHFPCVIGVPAVILNTSRENSHFNNFMDDERKINRDTD